MKGRVDIIVRVHAPLVSELPLDVIIWTNDPIWKRKAESNADELLSAMLKIREARNEQDRGKAKT